MELKDFFSKYPRVALAFSGGVDSAYLLSEAVDYAKKVRAYYVKTIFQPDFEWEDAQRLARDLNVDLKVISLDLTGEEKIVSNPPNRCYYCKRRIFSAIQKEAALDGFSVLLDGTNASDQVDDRPGMKVLNELHVLSPLRLCGLTKEEIRHRSKEKGLFTWNKPAYACLATRIPSGQRIQVEDLQQTEMAEDYLFQLGFSDFRVRNLDGKAKLELREEDLPRLLAHREEIIQKLGKYYHVVLLDLEVRK